MIGRVEQGREVLPVARPCRGPDACREIRSAEPGRRSRAQHRGFALGDQRAQLLGVAVADEHDELVTPDARHERVVPGGQRQLLGDGDEQAICPGVAVVRVDALEVVAVDDEQAGALRGRVHLDVRAQAAQVVDAREGVRERLATCLRLGSEQSPAVPRDRAAEHPGTGERDEHARGRVRVVRGRREREDADPHRGVEGQVGRRHARAEEVGGVQGREEHDLQVGRIRPAGEQRGAHDGDPAQAADDVRVHVDRARGDARPQDRGVQRGEHAPDGDRKARRVAAGVGAAEQGARHERGAAADEHRDRGRDAQVALLEHGHALRAPGFFGSRTHLSG